MVKIGLLIISAVLIKSSYCFNFYNFSEAIRNLSLKLKINELEVSDGCKEQLNLFQKNLIFPTDNSWALEMIDAIGKIQSGILEANVAWMGNYDECLEIASIQQEIKGKYCLVSLVQSSSGLVSNEQQKRLKNDMLSQLQLPASPSLGVCVPNKCNEADVQHLINKIISVNPVGATCQTKDDLHKPLDTGALLTMTYFLAFIVLMILSTGYDLLSNKESERSEILLSFSVNTNGRRLFTASNNAGEFACLHGIKFLSMLWVIFGHSFVTNMYGPQTNWIDILSYLETTKSMIIANSVHSVDTFFVITGFLVVYVFMKSVQDGVKFNLFVYYIHRYLRLTSAFIPVVLSSIFLTRYLGSGPFYPQIETVITGPCRKYWWSTLLFIQNYYNNQDVLCISQSWYLNVDWQLYLISPIFLLFLPKQPKVGLSIMLCGMVSAMTASFVFTWQHQIQALGTNFHQSFADYDTYYYYETHTRAGTWFLGSFLGYIMAQIKLGNNSTIIKLPKWLVAAIWIIVLTVIPVCIFAGHDALTSEVYHPYSNAFFNSFARPAWGLCIAWIIFACSVGYGGCINDFLSLPIFKILSRFTYSIYLLHLSLLYILTFSAKHPGYFSMFNLAYSFWSIFALTFALSIFWVLAFESPITVLEKYLLDKYVRPPKQVKNRPAMMDGKSTNPV